MKGPFFLGSVGGKPFLVDISGCVLDRKTVEEIILAGMNLWDWSGGQIRQQHEDAVAEIQRRAGR